MYFNVFISLIYLLNITVIQPFSSLTILASGRQQKFVGFGCCNKRTGW